MRVLLTLFCFSFFSCGKKAIDSATFFRDKLYDKNLMDSLDNRVLNYGDTLAYSKLKIIHYVGEQRFTGFLYYALIMSNKYNHKTASKDVYEILTINDAVLDDKTKEIANEYLLKSK